MTKLFASASLVLSLTLLAGCANTGGVSMVVPISGGKKVAVPIGPRGVAPSEVEGVTVQPPPFTLSPEKKLVFMFDVADPRNRPLRSVRVEDVSDAEPVLLVEDNQAAWTDGHWRNKSRPLAPSEATWINTITNTLRVFRFTVTFADGKSVTIHQGSMYPNFLKRVVRHEWGEKY